MINSILISLYHPELSLWILQVVGAVLNDFDTSVLIVCWVFFILSKTEEIQELLSEPLPRIKKSYKFSFQLAIKNNRI